MQNRFQALPPETPLFSLAQMRGALDTARLNTGPFFRAIEMAVLVPCDISHLIWADLKSIDRLAKTIVVETGTGDLATVKLCPFGLEAIDAASNGRSDGQVLMDMDGLVGFDEHSDAHGILVLGDGGQGRIEPFQFFDMVRASAHVQCIAAGVPTGVMAAQGGEGCSPHEGERRRALLLQQEIAAHTWADLLGLWQRPGTAADFHDGRRARRFLGFDPKATRLSFGRRSRFRYVPDTIESVQDGSRPDGEVRP